MNDLRARVDELGRKVRGIDELEKRVAKLEKEVTALKRAQKPKASTAARRRARQPSSRSVRLAASPSRCDSQRTTLVDQLPSLSSSMILYPGGPGWISNSAAWGTNCGPTAGVVWTLAPPSAPVIS